LRRLREQFEHTHGDPLSKRRVEKPSILSLYRILIYITCALQVHAASSHTPAVAHECYIFDGLTSREKSIDSAFSLASDMPHRSISSIPGGTAHSRTYSKAGDQKEELLNEFFVLSGRYPVNYWDYSRPEMWQRVQGEKWLLEEEEEKQRDLLKPQAARPLPIHLGLPLLNTITTPLAPAAASNAAPAATPALKQAPPERGPRRLIWQRSDKETLAKAFEKHGNNWRNAADDTSLPFAPILMRLSGRDRANKLKVIVIRLLASSASHCFILGILPQ
jgi:hypothetical protein